MKPDFKELLDSADHVIVITVDEGGAVGLSFSDGLDEMDVLDALSFVTSEWYGMAKEGPSHPREN